MHEMSIALSLLDIIRDEMLKNNAKVLKSVRVHIGQLTAIVPDSLSFCFDVMTKGTELEGAKLILEIIPLVGHCYSCDKDFQIDDYAFACPYCQSTDIKVISGEELSVVEMEVE